MRISTLCVALCILLRVDLGSCRVMYSTIQCVNETLQPCTTHPEAPDSILCENINDIRTFVHVIRCGSRRNMREVFLERSTLEYLPLYILDFCGFIFLNVKSVVLSKLLEGNILVRLERLHLEGVIVQTPGWTWEPLSVLRNLKNFSVSGMKVPKLDPALLDNLPDGLRSLSLVLSGTAEVADEAFTKFVDMEQVAVEDNGLVELKRSMFSTPSKIKNFHFARNRISRLPDDLFLDMPDLRSVALQGNMLFEMHEHVWRPVWRHLEELHFHDNPLKCHCKMLWLAKKTSPAIFTGECYAPKYQYGKLLKHLNINDFQCM